MYNVRTDLAVEAASIFNKPKEDVDKLNGVEADFIKKGNCVISRVKITDKNGEEIIGKPIGTYITVDCPKLRESSDEIFNEASELVSNELKHILEKFKFKTALVVGLGNWNVTPDALGPKVVSHLTVTRHLKEYIPDANKSLCAISPGVLGITGIETSEIICGICDKVRPDIVIAIDALASRKMERISTTFQICDTGIVPGSGIGNKRKGLTKEILGVPVIAIGVPTVVDAATVANDSIEMLINNIKQYSHENSNLKKSIEFLEHEDRYSLVKEVLKPYVGELIVTPKEVDTVIDDASKIIANGINMSILSKAENLKETKL